MKYSLRRIILPITFLLLTYGFWVSPDFKEISAGVAIFLFGMLSLEEGFRAFTGGMLEKILRRTTNRLWKSFSFGVMATTIMQSSSLVSVITISFLSAGLIGLAEGIGIVFGSNLGTTTGAWLVAGFGLKVKISAYAMPMLVFGMILIFQSSKKLKGAGYILAGLGFLFLGVHFMKEGFDAFKDTLDLAEYAIEGLPGLLLYALIGIVATVIMQSSHATLVLIITALAAQQLSYENALALAIGSNIGTTITAIIGSISSNEQGKRLAGAHLIFNLSTGFIAIAFIHQFMLMVDVLCAWVGIAADDFALKLAMFHTLFNLVGIMVMLPLIGRLVDFLEKNIKAEQSKTVKPKYLTDSALEFTGTAIEALRKETTRIYHNSCDIIAQGLSMTTQSIFSTVPLDDVIKRHNTVIDYDVDAAYVEKIKGLYGDIIIFSGKVSVENEAVEKLARIQSANKKIIMALKDTKHLQKNISNYMGSDNGYIKDEYNNLRKRIARVLRRLNRLDTEQQSGASVLSFDALKVRLQEESSILHKRLERLIRANHISPEMGISLMKDAIYADEIVGDLIEIGSSLFYCDETDEVEAEHLIALDDDEIDEIIESGVSK